MTPAEVLVEGRALLARHQLSDMIHVSSEFYFGLFCEPPVMFDHHEHIVQGYWLMQELDNLEERIVQRVTNALTGAAA